jgi:hypothetical protein
LVNGVASSSSTGLSPAITRRLPRLSNRVELKDQGIAKLLKDLAQIIVGRCVVTTRIELPDLKRSKVGGR